MFLNKWFDGNSGELIKVIEMGRYFFNWKSKDFFFFFQNGEIQPMSVKVGEKVLLPEYGGTKIVLEDKVGFQTLWVQIRTVPETPVINTVVTS